MQLLENIRTAKSSTRTLATGGTEGCEWPDFGALAHLLRCFFAWSLGRRSVLPCLLHARHGYGQADQQEVRHGGQLRRLRGQSHGPEAM